MIRRPVHLPWARLAIRPTSANSYNNAVDSEIAQTLIRLNQQFYQTFAEPFSASRQRIQPGVRKAIRQIAPEGSVLDLGCGNGRLWQELLEMGFRGEYVGLDYSDKLLEEATRRANQVIATRSVLCPPSFLKANLAEENWQRLLPRSNFEYVLAFAVLHHLPGRQLWTQALRQIGQLLAPGGKFSFSVWQFLNSQKLRERIQDWSEIGLTAEQVDPGDYLLDWRQGGFGLRYVHAFTTDELQQLASSCGYDIVEAYLSDGKGGNLSLYQTWIMKNVIV